MYASLEGVSNWSTPGRRGSSDEGYASAGLVDVPHIQPLIFFQTLLKLGRSVPLRQDPLPGLVKPVRQEVMS